MPETGLKQGLAGVRALKSPPVRLKAGRIAADPHSVQLYNFQITKGR
jgi:hypothetical protein